MQYRRHGDSWPRELKVKLFIVRSEIFLPIRCRFANKRSKSLIGRKFEGSECSPDFFNTLTTKVIQVGKQEAIIVDLIPLNKHNFNHDLTNIFFKINTETDMQIPNLVIPNCMDISFAYNTSSLFTLSSKGSRVSLRLYRMKFGMTSSFRLVVLH